MEDYFESFSEDITKWELIKDMIDLDLDDGLQNDHKTVPSVQLLPRRAVVLYGTIPKMEQRIYTKCKECRLVFNPKDILSHKACSGKSHSSSSHSLKKKVKSKGNSTKKSHSNLPPPPLFKKSPSPSAATASISIPEISAAKVSSPKISKVSSISSTPPTPTTTTSSPSKSETRVSSSTSSKSNSHSPKSPSKSSTSEHSTKSKPADSNSSSSSSSSSKHKKSRKSNSNTKITKEFDPDVHCGVIEGNRGPCTRSITCNNHRIQLRKLVTGRSKDIHQLIAERKTVKKKSRNTAQIVRIRPQMARQRKKTLFLKILPTYPLSVRSQAQVNHQRLIKCRFYLKLVRR